MKKAIIVLFLFSAIYASCMAGGEDVMTRRISVTGNTGRVVFELNDSNAADNLDIPSFLRNKRGMNK